LLDLAMPKMDGFQLARQLRQQKRFEDALLVATTGYGDEAHRRLGAEAGFDQYLLKPIEPATVEALLLREQYRLAGSPTNPRHSRGARPFGAC
jgi:two-component system CheB/CheR fusion protein